MPPSTAWNPRCWRRLLALIAWLWIGGCVAPRAATVGPEPVGLDPAARRPVHVHFVNSPNDPLQLTGFASLARAVNGPGRSVRYWPFADPRGLARAIFEDRQRQPEAAVAVVAWSGASLAAWDAAELLAQQGQRLDRVVVLDSDWLKRRLRSRRYPDNIDLTILIYRERNPPPDETQIGRHRLHRVPTPHHLAVATHPATVEALEAELDALAQPR